ncbi:MAG: RsiV family protein [Pseudomonadota bacterium]
MRAVIALAFAASTIAAAPAWAETISLKTSSGPATLVLSDALGAHPRFATFLREDAREIALDYETENARRIRVEDQATYVDGTYASVFRRIEADLGGAAGANVYVEGLVWDGGAEDFLRLDDLFDAGEARDEALIALSRHLREGIRTQVWGGRIAKDYEPLVEQATSPDAAVLSNFTLKPGAAGLTFHYSPFEVAPYARGAIAVDAPTAVFAKWLNRKGQSLF